MLLAAFPGWLFHSVLLAVARPWRGSTEAWTNLKSRCPSVALHPLRLRLVRAEDHSVGLRLLSDRCDDLTEERTRTANRLHAVLRDLIAGGRNGI
jgi:hypothetical protein